MNENKIIPIHQSLKIEDEAVIINDLTLNAKFGFYAKEKAEEQKLIFNIKLFIEKNSYKDLDLKEVVDYDQIILIIKNILKKEINFLETLASSIIDQIFLDQRINKIYLKIEKPDVIKECKSVGYEITKKR
ncbi:MAG: dihydroneopterin aldolase [Pelagibacteraceae bacterium]